MASWVFGLDGAPNADVRAQVFNADGTRSGAEFVVNTFTLNDQTGPSIAGLSGIDGKFVATWTTDAITNASPSAW